MSAVRQNTLVVDFSVLPKRPDAEVIQQFFEKKVKLRLADTKNIQFHNIKNCVYIEMVDNETALRYEEANLNKHTIVCNKVRFKIPIYVDSEAVTVRVHDLPSHTHHLTVVNFFQQYGVVISISRERWKNYFPGVYNGVRVLRMKLNSPIPSCVTIDGEQTLVTYRNQPKLCNHCGQPFHPKGKCITSRTANSSKTQSQAAPSTDSSPPLDGDDFPPLSAVEPNLGLDSTLTKTHEVRETEQSGKNNKNDSTSGNNDDCGDDDDDDNDDDDHDGDDDDDDNSSDGNGFVEASNQKRRLSKRMQVQNELANEKKKVRMNQGSQNACETSNRFQALVEIGSVCPSTEEMDEYVNRLNTRKDKNNVS